MKTNTVATFLAFVLGIVAVEVFSHDRASGQQNAPGSARAQDPLPGTKLSVDQLKAEFFHVSAGRRLKPKTWPNGARVAVLLSFDLDDASPALARQNLTLWNLSEGEYGGIDGLPRVLSVLDKHQVPATFFVPAVSDILQPTIIPSILAKKRHEIGAHGWIHEDLSQLGTEAEEKRLLDQSLDYLKKVTGKPVVGFRSPGATFSPYSIKLLKNAGILYESTLMSSDDAYELNLDSQPTGVIELPIEWIDDDAPYNGRTGTMPSPTLQYQVYKEEFDMAYGEGRLFVLTMHPHITGHRSRLTHLDQFIEYMKSKPGVWFATGEQIAKYVQKTPTVE